MLIAITGGYGSGKSTVLQALRDLEAETLSCDDIVRELRATKDSGLFTHDPEIFSDFDALYSVEKKIHPLVFSKIFEYYAMLNKERKKNLYIEIPILFERGYEIRFDYVIGVYTNPVIIGGRLSEKRLSDYFVRSRWQVSSDIVLRKSDFIINNSKNDKSTFFQTTAIYDYIEGAL